MPYRAWMNRWKRRHTFKLEIAGVVILKALLLTAIWYFFFSNPLQDHLNDRLMADHFVGQSQINHH